MMHDAADAQDSRPGLAWLVRLRWLAVCGQLVASFIALAIGAELDLVALYALIGTSALSNVALLVATRRPIARVRLLVAVVLAVDTAALTGMLAASGGSMNPCSVFYLVQVVLAGQLLGARGAWAMAGLTSVGFGLLFIVGPDNPHAKHMHGASSLHLQGMWAAYALAAAFVATFVSGIARALRRRDLELARLRERALETERGLALSAFSAGAAHELGTPLSTIAVVAADVVKLLDDPAALDSADARARLVEDARLMRAETERCRDLLTDLSMRAGTWAGEMPEALALTRVVAEVRERLPPGGRARLSVALDAPADAAIIAPRRSLVQSLANLVSNALDASADGPVELAVAAGAARLRFVVRDRGAGFPPTVLTRLGEPFVTTKVPGHGMGLGLHLAMSFANKLGGALTIVARAGGGSEVVLELPRDAIAEERAR